jgi:hypothetical protein
MQDYICHPDLICFRDFPTIIIFAALAVHNLGVAKHPLSMPLQMDKL